MKSRKDVREFDGVVAEEVALLLDPERRDAVVAVLAAKIAREKSPHRPIRVHHVGLVYACIHSFIHSHDRFMDGCKK